MSARARSLLYLLGAALLWSTSGLVVKSVDWTPPAIAASRGLFTFFALLALNRGRLRPPAGAQWLAAALFAIICLTFITATKLTTAANAIFLQYTAPAWVALLAPLLLREATRGRDWCFVALTFGGMALFFMDSLSTEGMLGILIAILGGIAFAGLTMVLRHTPGDEKLSGLIYGNLLLIGLGLFVWRPPWPGLADVLLLAFAGIFQMGLGYYLFSLASRQAAALDMVLITMIEPVLNPVWVFLGTGETPGAWAFAGGACVLVSITIWSVLKIRN
jgi:drug/metabolite transporter (DMT)-like permease